MDEAECIDRQPTAGRSVPEPDAGDDTDLRFESVTVEGGWTTVTFLKPTVVVDDQDYDLATVRFWRSLLFTISHLTCGSSGCLGCVRVYGVA